MTEDQVLSETISFLEQGIYRLLHLAEKEQKATHAPHFAPHWVSALQTLGAELEAQKARRKRIVTIGR